MNFDDIRPFAPDELPAVYDRLLADQQFRSVLAYLYPGVAIDDIAVKMHGCKTNLEFQIAFCYPFLKKLMQKASKGLEMDFAAVDRSRCYTFVSNHRDIVLDSALLDVLLFDAGFTTTAEIAIGDNLLKLPWVKDLVRVNKSFIVERSLPPRQMLMASARLSSYMHYAIGEKNENIWIAQREGRAKDSNDRTAPAILKMMAMGGEGTPLERLRSLHIVPLSISYEYDPCDFLKAREMQQRRDNADFKKGPMDDVVSMRTGIMGYKGRVFYRSAPCIDEWLASIDGTTAKNDLFDIVARHIDQAIFRGYQVYPVNAVALDILRDSGQLPAAEGLKVPSGLYTQADKDAFEQYLSAQMAKIELPQPDLPFLRLQMLKMYANPYLNYLSATQHEQ